MADFTYSGKQVLKDGLHYADARSHKAAIEIVIALSHIHPEFICTKCGLRQDSHFPQGEVNF